MALLGLVFGLGSAAAQPDAPHIRYFGHYFVESAQYGRHLGEVADHCNIHWVQGLAGLKNCAKIDAQCILETRWQFFSSGTDDAGKATSVLRPDYETQWQRLAEAVRPHIESVGAFYMLDEPYWRGASKPDLDTAIATVKADFPDTPVMVVFARPSLTDELEVPEQADWVGFDLYASIDEVERYMKLLKSRLHPHQKLFLVPQSFINAAAPTDEALAELNEAYYTLAASEPLAIGLLNFGLFTSTEADSIPETVRAQREIGARILANAEAAPPANP